jgi:hypothetical protein
LLYELSEYLPNECPNHFADDTVDFSKDRISEAGIKAAPKGFWDRVLILMEVLYESVNTDKCWHSLATKDSLLYYDNQLTEKAMIEDLARLIGGSKLSFKTLWEGKYPGGKSFVDRQKKDYSEHTNYKIHRDCKEDVFFRETQLRRDVCGQLNEYFDKGPFCGDMTNGKGPLRKFWAETLRMINDEKIVLENGEV